MKKILLATIFLVTTPITKADTNLYAGYAASGENSSLELQLGYMKRIDRITLTLNYLAGIIYSGETPEGYREETFSNGNTICRNLSNGQFADEENCESKTEIEYAPSIEASYSITDKISVGAGYRGGDENGVIGKFEYLFGNSGYLSLRGGSEYLGLGVGGYF